MAVPSAVAYDTDAPEPAGETDSVKVKLDEPASPSTTLAPVTATRGPAKTTCCPIAVQPSWRAATLTRWNPAQVNVASEDNAVEERGLPSRDQSYQVSPGLAVYVALPPVSTAMGPVTT